MALRGQCEWQNNSESLPQLPLSTRVGPNDDDSVAHAAQLLLSPLGCFRDPCLAGAAAGSPLIGHAPAKGETNGVSATTLTDYRGRDAKYCPATGRIHGVHRKCARKQQRAPTSLAGCVLTRTTKLLHASVRGSGDSFLGVAVRSTWYDYARVEIRLRGRLRSRRGGCCCQRLGSSPTRSESPQTETMMQMHTHTHTHTHTLRLQSFSPPPGQPRRRSFCTSPRRLGRRAPCRLLTSTEYSSRLGQRPCGVSLSCRLRAR